jgi:probable HAF family extracellular repeat protein
MRRLLFAGAVCTLLLRPAGPSVLADGPTYTITNLGTIEGVVPHVTGINTSGDVSGWYSSPSGGDHAIRYTAAGGWAVIPGLESASSYAFGINDRGDVVGYSMSATFQIRAFRYTDAGGVELIAPMAGGSFTFPGSINNAGEITGYGDITGGTTRAFRQLPGLPAQPIDPFGGTFSGGCGINDSGQVAGIAYTTTRIQHGFRADPGGVTVAEIPGLGGPASANMACAIDADGSVTGFADTVTAGVQHAFLYKGGSVMDLDSFGSSFSQGIAIKGGVVAGTYTVDGTTYHAFKYSVETGGVDLNMLLPSGSGWVLMTAVGVNAKGAILGEGTINELPAAWVMSAPPDTIAPTITSLSVNPSILKPNHHMEPVTVSVTATDNVGASPSCSLTSVSATEASAADAMVTGQFTASVLAEKDSRGTTRVYTLTVSCSDAAQNVATGEVTVQVPSGNGSVNAAKKKVQ